ncbi:MAG: prepilin peptidase [Bacteroides sp.]
MKIIGACFGAAVIAVLYYLAVCKMDTDLQMQLERKGKLISAKGVWITGILTAAVWIYVGMRSELYVNVLFLIQTMVIVWAMSVFAVTDYYKNIIPNIMIIFLLAVWAVLAGAGLIINMDTGLAVLFQSLIGGIVGGVIFLLCYLVSRGQLGAGDVKLAFVLGLYLTGERIMGALIYGIVICCVYSLVQLARKKIGMKDGVPLVPFLYIGMLITFIIL